MGRVILHTARPAPQSLITIREKAIPGLLDMHTGRIRKILQLL